jgi:glycerol-3-phosphate dehydrogenase
LEDYERTYLIDYVNRYLETPVTEKDVTSGFAGQRPLLEAKLHTALDSETKSLVRDHEVEIDKRSKLVSIMGGKWTTYRLMAKDTVDMVQENVLKQSVVECTTDQQVLFGGEGYLFDDWKILVNKYNVSIEVAQHLMKKYGSNAGKVLELSNKDADLKSLLVAGHPFIKAEVVYAVRHEMACTKEDVLLRRLGLALRDADAAAKAEWYVEEVLKG